MNQHGAELSQGLNGMGALIKSLDSHSLTDQIHGALWLSASINSYNDPNIDLSSNTPLNNAVLYLSWLDAAQSLRTGLKSGDGNTIRMAVASATSTILNVMASNAKAETAKAISSYITAIDQGDSLGAAIYEQQAVEANASAAALGTAVQAITRLEVTGGNYVELFTGNDYNHGTLFNMDGSQRSDSATSDKFGQGMIEVFVRDAIVPMWDVKLGKRRAENDEAWRKAA
jgi:hypothetical protein